MMLAFAYVIVAAVISIPGMTGPVLAVGFALGLASAL